jgi:hypothetical protein
MTKARANSCRPARRAHPRSRKRDICKGAKDQYVPVQKSRPRRRRGADGDLGRGRERQRGGNSLNCALLLDGEEDPFCTPFKEERICVVYEDSEPLDEDYLFAPRTPPQAPHRPATAAAPPAHRPTRSHLSAVSVRLCSAAVVFGGLWRPVQAPVEVPAEDLNTLRGAPARPIHNARLGYAGILQTIHELGSEGWW